LQSALTLGGNGCLDVTPLNNQQLEPKSQPIEKGKSFSKPHWLVVSTHLKNMSQNANLPQIGVKIKNM